MADYDSQFGENVLNSEEKLALERMVMGEGLSDSTIVESVIAAQMVKGKSRKTFVGLPVPKHRDAMGKYLPPPGGKPLSCLEREISPGPKYDPSYDPVLKCYPHYSFGTAPRAPKPRRQPGPKYDVRGNLKWGKCRRFPHLQKHPELNKGLVPGPDFIAQKPFTPSGPKISIGTRIKKAPELNSPLVMPINQEAPAPSYNLPPETWLEKPQTLGSSSRAKTPSYGPGPGKYSGDCKTAAGPRFTFGCARPEAKPSIGPGPGKYKDKSGMGEGPSAHMCSRQPETDTKAYIPGPDVYHRAGFRLDEPGYTMKARWIEPDIVKWPGPADYTIRAPKPPVITIKQKQLTKSTSNTPGPADYSVPDLKGSPGKSFGTKWTYSDTKPSGHTPFASRDQEMALLPRSPAFTLQGPHLKTKTKFKTPAPNKYTPKTPDSKALSIGKRFSQKSTTVGPGPAPPLHSDDNNCGRECTCEFYNGATLKGRHTPLKYIGLKNSAMAASTPRGLQCAPLII